MKLSTRSRYGLRLMLALARNYGKGNTFLKDIAHEEEISEKYLSLIIIPLKSVGLVNSVRGSSGGYTLAKEPSQITLKDIVDVLEGDCLVDCLKNPRACSKVSTCASRDIWALLGVKISETLSSITLEQLVLMNKEKMEKAISPSI
ncbi:MAG: Rrf2 family transcriptional regulator [Deltaproteobacteria bacterium]|nr:Rrf2 family transcriptional regulator [Deltaproteobacteria bacterium]